MRFLLFIVISIAVTFGCGESKKIMTRGRVVETKKIQLEKPAMISSFTEGDGYFVFVDRKTSEVCALDGEGKIFWTYKKEGKGPGEFSQSVQIAGINNNTLYVYDGMLKKIMSFAFDDRKKAFTFVDEVILDNGNINTVYMLKDGTMCVSLMMAKSELIHVNADGSFIQEIIPGKQIDMTKMSGEEIREYFSNLSFVRYFDGEKVILAKFMTGNVVFGTFKNNTYTISATVVPKFALKEEKADIKTSSTNDSRSISVKGKGFLISQVHNGEMYLMAPEQEGEEKKMMECYDLNGVLKGVYVFPHKKNELPMNIYIASNGKVWFQKNIFKDDGTEELDMTSIYQADFKEYNEK